MIDHIQGFMQYIEIIKRSDPSFSIEHQLLLLASTLPKGEEWKNFSDADSMNCSSLEKAKFYIQNYCRERTDKSKDFENAFFTSGSKSRFYKQTPEEKEAIKKYDFENNLCQYCHKKGHFARE